jgi:hypothetical protein
MGLPLDQCREPFVNMRTSDASCFRFRLAFFRLCDDSIAYLRNMWRSFVRSHLSRGASSIYHPTYCTGHDLKSVLGARVRRVRLFRSIRELDFSLRNSVRVTGSLKHLDHGKERACVNIHKKFLIVVTFVANLLLPILHFRPQIRVDESQVRVVQSAARLQAGHVGRRR